MRHLTNAIALGVALATSQLGLAQQTDQASKVLLGDGVRIEVRASQGRLSERYLAERDGDWFEVARAGEGTSGPAVLVDVGSGPLDVTVREVTVARNVLVE